MFWFCKIFGGFDDGKDYRYRIRKVFDYYSLEMHRILVLPYTGYLVRTETGYPAGYLA
jgi:hypothetical protein